MRRGRHRRNVVEMHDLFAETENLERVSAAAPLATRMRPRTLGEFVGQEIREARRPRGRGRSARRRALNRGAAGGRRPGTSSTTRSRRTRRPCASCARPLRLRRRVTTATVAAPADEARWRRARRPGGGHGDRASGAASTHAGVVRDDGQAVDDLFVLGRLLRPRRRTDADRH